MLVEISFTYVSLEGFSQHFRTWLKGFASFLVAHTLVSSGTETRIVNSNPLHPKWYLMGLMVRALSSTYSQQTQRAVNMKVLWELHKETVELDVQH